MNGPTKTISGTSTHPIIGAGVLGIILKRGKGSKRLSPAPERLVSSAKTKYKLLHRRVYLVEEDKPDFSMRLFSDILKGRCWDCEDDESFACESLVCGTCNLPCPCKGCKKYSSRTHGLMITRQYPKDVRTRHFLQTTPIVWLSQVAGDENMDPAKLSLLTDYITNFMEKSQNGVILVDGIEYMVTSNDFNKVLKAIDRWTETAMTTSNKLIITINPKAFESKDLALLERTREVVRPEATKPWQIIPERI
jgi:hypothetical protein